MLFSSQRRDKHNFYLCSLWKLRLNHCSYTPDGGTWLSSPSGGRQAHYNMEQGQKYQIAVDIKRSFEKLDKINVVNIQFFTQLTFEYEITAV